LAVADVMLRAPWVGKIAAIQVHDFHAESMKRGLTDLS
jgi:hypothetical protein